MSNISFGLNAYARRVLNSVFMHEAVNNGLDMAIVNYSKIYPLYKIPEAEVELARKADLSRPLARRSAAGLHGVTLPGQTAKSDETARCRGASVEDKLKY